MATLELRLHFRLTKQRPRQSEQLTPGGPTSTVAEINDDGGGTVKISVDNLRHALDIIGDGAGREAAIVARFALDLAIMAQV